MRDENDWRIGDKITEGPDWRNSFRKPWDEHWTFGTAGKWEPIVRKVYRCHGNVIRVNIGHARGSFAITVNGKRYILNPACRNGGYRSNNNPDPKYQTDANGRFVRPKGRLSNSSNDDA
jgi:hypothetical protein